MDAAVGRGRRGASSMGSCSMLSLCSATYVHPAEAQAVICLRGAKAHRACAAAGRCPMATRVLTAPAWVHLCAQCRACAWHRRRCQWQPATNSAPLSEVLHLFAHCDACAWHHDHFNWRSFTMRRCCTNAHHARQRCNLTSIQHNSSKQKPAHTRALTPAVWCCRQVVLLHPSALLGAALVARTCARWRWCCSAMPFTAFRLSSSSPSNRMLKRDTLLMPPAPQPARRRQETHVQV